MGSPLQGVCVKSLQTKTQPIILFARVLYNGCSKQISKTYFLEGMAFRGQVPAIKKVPVIMFCPPGEFKLEGGIQALVRNSSKY
jgi:hypothetical protein